MRRVILFTIALNDYSRAFADCIRSQQDYCKRHGYYYVQVTQAPRPLLPAEASWLKVALIENALKDGDHLVVYLDADIEVRPHTPPILDYLADDETHSIFLVPGKSGRINAGVLIARSTDAARTFFSGVLSRAEEKIEGEDWAPYENGHIIRLARDNDHIRLLDHVLWNNNSSLDEQAYLQHYAAGPLREHYLDSRRPGGAGRGFMPLSERLRLLWRKLVPAPPIAVNRRGHDHSEPNFSDLRGPLAEFYARTYPQLAPPSAGHGASPPSG